MCLVTYQEVNMDPSDLMESANCFVWKQFENPGRYVIQTTSNLYSGSASMTIRQYIKGELKGETKIYIKIIDIQSSRKRTGNPLTLNSGLVCQTQSYRIEAGKVSDITLPLCIFKNSEFNQGIIDVNLGTIKKFSKRNFV